MQQKYDTDVVDDTPVTVKPTTNGNGDAANVDITQTNVSSIFWGQWFTTRRGIFQGNFGFPAAIVNRNSQVSVSITEVTAANQPFLGDAGMSVLNVVPQDDGTVTVRANVAWGAPLRCALNFIIVN
jgi:hypothetical protein